MPLSAPFPIATITAVGVARPSAHGQAMTRTEINIFTANEKSFKKINQVISYFNLGGISDRKAFDLIDEAYDIRYKYNLISETEYNNLIRKNEIKKFSRKLIPEKLYIKLKDYKKRYNSRNWDNIL